MVVPCVTDSAQRRRIMAPPKPMDVTYSPVTASIDGVKGDVNSDASRLGDSTTIIIPALKLSTDVGPGTKLLFTAEAKTSRNFMNSRITDLNQREERSDNNKQNRYSEKSVQASPTIWTHISTRTEQTVTKRSNTKTLERNIVKANNPETSERNTAKTDIIETLEQKPTETKTSDAKIMNTDLPKTTSDRKMAEKQTTETLKRKSTADANFAKPSQKKHSAVDIKQRWGRGTQGNRPLILLTSFLCLVQLVPTTVANSMGTKLFTTGYGEVMYGHGSLDPDYAHNQTVSCPGSCVCADGGGGFRVDCSGQNLTQVPRGIPVDTTHLDLSMNNISTLPENAFFHLTSLQDLRLASNKLRRLPKKVFRKNNFLSTVYLQGNKFESVPRGALQNLRNLQQLHLDANQIREVPANCFKNLVSLQQLWLDYNNLTKVPTRALSFLPKLGALTLALNNITTIPNSAFRNLSNLVVLVLHDNKISDIGDYAFLGLKSLRILELNKNRLKHMPTSLSHLESLVELDLDENDIETLPDNSFSRNRKLTLIQLHKNPIRSIGTRAFSHLPSLEKIVLSEVTNMFSFPDLNGTFNLTQIRLDRASIKVVPPGICHHRPWLKSFDIHSNKITMIPDLSSCNMLLNLNLGNNQLLTLEGKPFQGLTQLRDLTLNHNKFNHIPADAFFGLTKLQYLDLAHNMIKTIHPSAFLSLNSIEDLNLGDNKIQALPTQGLQSLQKLKTFDNEDLRDFPLKEAFPKVYNLVLNYAYHCCDFLQSASLPTDTVEMVDEKVTWLRNGKEGAEDVWQEHYYNLTEFWTTHFDNHTPELWEDIQNNEYDPDEYDFSKEAEIYLEDYETGHGDVYVKNLVVAKPPVTCKPKPGPFMPCDDLFGWWSLRCGVWFVFMLALLGNAVVLFVSVSSRTKMDVPRFLICNLACADFCMGVYLGILAMVDASTLGEFRKHAIQWQISGGCLVAGFLGVLSSELSVFTLTVITLERFYAITHAMQLNKRLSLRQAGYVMLGGWLWTITLASLPLFGISDYRKFAICLPFEVEDIISKSYVCFILVFNGVSFCIILACYLCMYLSIRHSQAWNSNDTRVAKRMALLVFTDFLCWAPIAFFSIGASFGKNLIDLSGAKVLTIFVLPLNSCANPFLYAIFTKQFKRDCVLLCRRLEDSSIARHFSRVSNRHASFTWGSSRRPSQLHSLVNGEKGGSCSHSMSAGSALGGGVVYHSDPDSGKGSLDYEKVPQSDTPSSHEGCNCHLAANNKGDAEEGGRDYNTTNAYNEMLTRCNLQNTRADEGGTCSWQCRDCHVIMHQQHNAYTTSGGGGGGGGGRTTRLSSDDYNCTTETYLPNSDVDQDPPPGNASNAHRQRQHQHRGGNGNKKSGNSGGSRGHKEREEACGKAGCGCSKEKKKQRGGGGGEKRSRKELVVPVITFTKGGTDKVDIHSPRGGGTEGVTRCCRGGDRGGGDGGGGGCLGGALSCCSGANSSPVENEHHHHRHNHHHHHHHQRHHHDPSCTSSPTPPLPGPNNNDTHTSPAPTTTKITVTQHSGDVTQDDVMVKPDDADSGHDIGIDGGSAYRGSSIDDGVAEMGGGNGEFEHGEGDDREEAEGEDRNAHRGESSLNVQGHGAGSSSRNAKSANQAPNPAATSNTATIAPCRRVLDKSEHMRFFTDSLTTLPHACRSNSLVELTQTSQAKLTAPLHAPRGAPKRLSLTPRQEGFLFLNNVAADDNSPYLDDEEDPEFPPYEELQRYLHASKKHKGRAHALDRSAAQQDEVSGLLEGSNSASPSHAPDGVKSLKAACFDKKSGFSSEY